MIELFQEGIAMCKACLNGLTGKTKTCYACEKGLVGAKKHSSYEEWECCCSEWECRCKKTSFFYCPLCENTFAESEYLRSVIKNTNTLWIANMITHHRHKHITSWNKRWDNTYKGHQYVLDEERYAEEKNKINERAKRVILRKATAFLRAHKITLKDFEQLTENQPETIALASKLLSK